MKISLNLASRPYTDHGPAIRNLRIAMAICLVLLAGLAWGLESFHQSAVRIAHDQAQLDQSIARIRSEQAGYQAQMRLPQNDRVLTQATFLNKLFEQKSFSWTMVMEDLEPVLPAGVQVTAIEPQRNKNGSLTLHIRVSGPRQRSVELLRNMEHSRRFVSPRITGETAENSSSAEGVQAVSAPSRVSFDILAEYSQATPQERKATAHKPAVAAPEAAPSVTPMAQSPAPGRPALQAPIRPAYQKSPAAPAQPMPSRPLPIINRPVRPGGAQ
jgi:type IV pilus assembly protein PilN